jgi:hypothetical protein
MSLANQIKISNRIHFDSTGRTWTRHESLFPSTATIMAFGTCHTAFGEALTYTLTVLSQVLQEVVVDLVVGEEDVGVAEA